MKTVSGDNLFPIGIGTWMMGGDWDAVNRVATSTYDNDEQDIAAIKYSLDKGQNHIDTAEMYGAGHTDELVGAAIAGRARENIFIADKLDQHSFGEIETRNSVDKMLKSLRTDYIDLLYIHSTFDDVKWESAVAPMNALIDEGVVKYFGVSNFSISDMKRAAELSTHAIAANQMHYNCGYKDEVPPEFMDYCTEYDIEIVAYRPVDRTELLKNDVVLTVAQKHNATPAQVAIAWLIQRGILTIPKASKTAHIDENFAAHLLHLDEQDFLSLNAM